MQPTDLSSHSSYLRTKTVKCNRFELFSNKILLYQISTITCHYRGRPKQYMIVAKYLICLSPHSAKGAEVQPIL